MRLRLLASLPPLLLTAPLMAAGISGSPTQQALDKASKANAGKKEKPAARHMSQARLREEAVKAGPIKPTIDQSHRADFPDPKTAEFAPRPGTYPWHFDITATYFYIGELATRNNPVPNTASSWDSMWDANYGGYDDPDPAHRDPVTFAPKAFTPQLNPFYVALPYNDIQKGGPKPEAARVIPWYRRDKEGRYESVCRGTWVQIYYKGRYCFAQWEDCGPFTTDDWPYVFGNARPKNTANKCAGIDISPAVRDYLGITTGTAQVHWRFVDFDLVPGGPWARYGKDNPFVNPELKQAVMKFKHRHNIVTTPDRRHHGHGGQAGLSGKPKKKGAPQPPQAASH